MVSEDLVEASWQEVGAFSAQRAHQHMMQLARRQKELLAFVTAMTADLSDAAQEMAIYAFVVICHMFESSSRKPLPKAKRARIMDAYEKINADLGSLTTAHEQFLTRFAIVATEKEPFVMRYVTEVLLEPDDPEELLNDDEIGEVFIYLKTVVDVLHDLSGPSAARL